jgi:hypothetical protein
MAGFDVLSLPQERTDSQVALADIFTPVHVRSLDHDKLAETGKDSEALPRCRLRAPDPATVTLWRSCRHLFGRPLLEYFHQVFVRTRRVPVSRT